MVKLYTTDDMEGAARQLAATNRNVIIFMRHRSARPIRMRMSKLVDLPIELAKAWQPISKATIERWSVKGGLLVYRPHPNSFKEVMPPSDAMLFIEAPYMITDFERITANVRQEVVVYRPPTWELHNETIEHLFPHAGTYLTMDSIFKSLVGRELTEEMQGALDASGYLPSKTAVFTAWDIEQLTGWNERFLKYALHHRYLRYSIRYSIYQARIQPDHDEALRWAYDILTSQPEVARGQYALRDDQPKGPYVFGFQQQLKRLKRLNYITREENIYVINLSGPPLQIDKLDAINNMYRGRWFKLKSLIDEAPEYYC